MRDCDAIHAFELDKNLSNVLVAQLSSADGTMADSSLYEEGVSRFNRVVEEDHQLWGLRLEAALNNRQLAGVLNNEMMNKKVNRRARAILFATLGDNTPRVIQSCTSTKRP